MTDASISIGIKADVRGGKVVKVTLDEIAKSGKKATNSVQSLDKQINRVKDSSGILRTAITALTSALSVREFSRISDSFTDIENRLKTVTDSVGQFNAAFDETVRISERTRKSLRETANIYARLSIATEDLNLSFEEQSKLVQGIQQTFRVSGATIAEATNATIQLSQGLASGALRGDEFRSVSEQNLVLTGLLAKELGVTRGELRELAAQGKITSDVVVNAVVPAFEQLESQADQLQLKLGEAFTLLNNKITIYLGKSSLAKDATNTLSNAIVTLADNIDIAFKAIGIAVGGIVSGIAATKAFSAGLAGLVAITNPIGLLAAAIGAVTVSVVAFKEEFSAVFITLFSEAELLITKVSLSLEALGLGFQRLFRQISAEELDEELIRLQRTQRAIEKQNREILDQRLLAQREGLGPARVVDPTLPNRQSNISNDIKRSEQQQKQFADVIKQTRTEQEKLLLRITELRDLRSIAKTAEETEALNRALQVANQQLETASNNIPGLGTNMTKLKSVIESFSQSASDAFADFVTGTQNAREALRGLVNDLLKAASRQFIVQPATNLFGSILSSAASGIFGGGNRGLGGVPQPVLRPAVPGFADGGSLLLGGTGGVDRNLLSLNGSPIARVSRGETMTVSPRGESKRPPVVVNQTINLSTGVQETVRSEVLGLLPEIQRSTQQAINDANSRGIS